MATPTKPNGSTSTALMKPVDNLRSLFKQDLVKLQSALPALFKKNAERLARCAITEFEKTPALANCTPQSIFSCAIQAGQLGLEIGGTLGQCYMVPFKNQAQFILGYRGMIALAFRSGEIANIYAEVVREHDKFMVRRGTDPGIDHIPCNVNAGSVIGAYAVVVYKTGAVNFEWMRREDIEDHRKRFSKQSGDYSPWATSWNEMAKKTVLRKVLKQCPMAVELPSEVFTDQVTPSGEVIQVKAETLAVATTSPEEPPQEREVDQHGNPLFDTSTGLPD